MDSPNQANEHTWGHSTHLYMDESCDLAIAVGEAGGGSSLHRHRDKANGYFVQDGNIEIWGNNTLIAALGPNESYVVAPGILHRMVFVTDATLYEFYVATSGMLVRLDDIERIDPGWKPGERKVVTRQEAMTDSAGNPLPRGCEFGKDSAV